MSDGFNETPVRGKGLHNAAAPAETAVATLPAIATNMDPSLSEGNVVALSTDLAGNLRVVIGGAENGATTQVDLVDQADRLVGIVSLDSATLASLNAGNDTVALDAGTLAALESIDLNATTRDDIVTRINDAAADQTDALLAGLESVSLNADTRDDLVTRLSAAQEAAHAATRTALESVDLNVATRDDLVTRLTAALESIDLNAATLAALEKTTPQVRGADVDDSNPLPVNIQTNPGTLVDSGVLTDDNVAPGATTTLASDTVGTGTGRLVEVTAHASVRMKVTVRADGVPVRVFFTDPTGSPLVYQPVDRDLHTAATGETFDVVLQNMDNLRTADLYASIAHVEF